MEARYDRQIRLDEVGLSGQKKLMAAKVLVVGAGGLGCPALQYLAAAGVGTLGIVDFDLVTLTNLHRQILFDQNDLGKNKAQVAKNKLEKLNSSIHIEAYDTAFNAENGFDLVAAYDLVVDASDNFETRYCINDCCVLLNKPMIYGALYKFQGQVAVFNYLGGPTYRCLFPTPPQAEEVPNCDTVGVLGVVPGVLGVMQATETLKIILSLEGVLSAKLLSYDLLKHHIQLLDFKPNKEAIAELKKSKQIQQQSTNQCAQDVEIGLSDITNNSNLIWVDVRELHETPQLSISNLRHLPPSKWETHGQQLEEAPLKIFFCQSGQRGRKAAAYFRKKGISNCFALKVGAAALEAWINNTQHEKTT